jgi:hypothetical protein
VVGWKAGVKIIRILLTIFFAWSLAKAASLFFRSDSMDRLAFESASLGWLFWLLLTGSVVASVITLVYLWRPSEIGFRVAVAGIALDLVLTIVATGIGMANPGLMKEAFIASRRERGLPVREEMLALMDNPVMQFLPVLFGVIVAGVCLYGLYRIHQETAKNAVALPAAKPWP